MKKILFLLLPAFSVLSSEPTDFNATVQEIQAQYLKDSGGEGYYQYKFGNIDNCKNYWIKSGDENINVILQMAYALGKPVDVGINGCSTVTFARTK